MDSKYKYYHKILAFLYDEWKENNEESTLVGSIKIAEKTKIPIGIIHKLQHVLVNNGDISIVNNDGQSMISIQQNGISSYVDKKYIKEGAKEFWDNIFNWTRIIIPLGALILSIINYINNNSLSKRIINLETHFKNINKIK
ncbi:hypothetical protein EH151_16285 [Elizabethkingia anophelis]|uniref:hypothetical protein n=1 Tax=Elizabethkingia anophelis TaxID=1117645 RepID=UPI00136CA18C|nr:hypothetical protein [Elizabethkingia anophelis]MYZ61440.1 hypothetical protein [Elizabethkingia anophelis]